MINKSYAAITEVTYEAYNEAYALVITASSEDAEKTVKVEWEEGYYLTKLNAIDDYSQAVVYCKVDGDKSYLNTDTVISEECVGINGGEQVIECSIVGDESESYIYDCFIYGGELTSVYFKASELPYEVVAYEITMNLYQIMMVKVAL